MLVALDNEVVFKRAFTDKQVFKGFIKDLLGLDVEVEKIETEKAFVPKVGNIAFKYDIFAETTDKRMIIEIQKVDYDYNFDRFLHYHIQGIAEQQRGFGGYAVERTVFTIIFVTAPYVLDDKTGQPVKDEVLVSALNPRNLQGVERDIYGHQLIFLNPNYRNANTPANIKDWLDLVYESIHHRAHPNINLANPAIRRASELIDYDEIDALTLEQIKIQESRKIARTVYEQKSREEGRQEGLAEGRQEGLAEGRETERKSLVKSLHALGVEKDKIAQATGLTLEAVEQLLSQDSERLAE